MRKFLDTNIVLRYLLADHPIQSPKAKRFLEKIEKGEEKVVTTPLVIAEVVYVLESTGASRQKISKALLKIISLRGLQVTNKRSFPHAFSVYEKKNIDFVDAYNAVYAKEKGIREIVSFDKDFDKLPGLERIEPKN